MKKIHSLVIKFEKGTGTLIKKNLTLNLNVSVCCGIFPGDYFYEVFELISVKLLKLKIKRF